MNFINKHIIYLKIPALFVVILSNISDINVKKLKKMLYC